MTNFIGRGIDIIGIRAVIQDVRQYQTDGRTLIRTDEQIAFAQEKVAAASVKAARVETIANLQRQASQNRLAKAYKDHVRDVSEATRKLNESVAKANSLVLTPAASTQRIPKGQKGAGQFAPAGSQFQGSKLLLGGSSELAKAKKDFDNAEAATVRLGNSLQNIRADGIFRVRQAVISLRQTQEHAIDAGINANNRLKRSDLERLQLLDRIKKAEQERRRIAAQLTTTAVAVSTVAVTGSALTEAAKYQDILAKIDAQTETTTADTQILGEKLLQLSTTMPVSAADQANAAFFALSSGIKNVNTAIDIATLASKAQVAQMGEAVDIAKVLTGVQNAYGKSNITVAATGDILTALVKEASVEAKDFTGEIGRVTGVSAKMNIKFSEAGAIIADLTNRQLTASEATTAYLGIINELEQRSPGQIEALKSVGLSFDSIGRSIEEKGIIQTLVDMTDTFTSQGKDIKDVFPNIRAYNGLLLTVSDRATTATAIFDKARNSTGALGEAFDVSKGRLSAVAQLLKNQLNVALIHIGQDLLPAATSALQDLSTWLKNNQEEIRKFIVDGVKAAASIISDFIKGILAIAKGLATVAGALTEITGVAPGAVVAVAAMAGALTWALPGGKYMAGLILMIELLGSISEKSTKSKLTIGGITAGAGILGTLLGGPQTGILAAGAAGNIASGLIGKDDGKKAREDKVAEAQKRAKEISDQLAASTQSTADAEKDLHNPRVQGQEDAAKLAKAEKEAFEAAKKLAEAFASSSEAAGQIDTLASKLKLFGEISVETANQFNLTPRQAGQVEGLDAVIRARERENRELFQTQKLVSAVAQAYQSSARVAQNIILQLAQSALSASQSALSDVLSRPTREVADLGVPLARQRQRTTALEFQRTPAINALNDQAKAIDRRIRDANKQREQAQKAAERQNKAAKEASDRASQQRDAMLDQMKLANLQAQIAAERQLDGIQKLIDANTKQQSDLQENFREQAEATQQKINEAIGKGDTQGALALTDELLKSGKAYQAQNKALEKNGQNLTTQLKQAQQAEEERQRQVRLQEALTEASVKAQEAQEKQTESVEANTDAIDANIESLEEQKQAIADQVEALEAPIEASKRQEEAIQNAIDLYETQGDVLRAQGIAADKTLDTQEQQWQKAKKLIAQIEIETGVVEKFSKLLGVDTLKSVNDANTEFANLQAALQVTQGNFKNFLDPFFDAQKKHDEIIAAANADYVEKTGTAGTTLVDGAKKASDELGSTLSTGIKEVFAGIKKAFEDTKPTDIKDITKGKGGGISDIVGIKFPDLDIFGKIKEIKAKVLVEYPKFSPGADFLGKLFRDAQSTNQEVKNIDTSASNLNETLRRIQPIEVIPEDALREVQEITGETYSMGAAFANAEATVYSANNAAGILSGTISLIPEPNVGDAGKQEIDSATRSTYDYENALRNIDEPYVGDAGRGEILSALDAAKRLSEALRGIGQAVGNAGKNLTNAVNRILPRYALGGLTPLSGGAFPAILHPNELVLPLNDENRVNELLLSIGKASSSGGTSGGLQPITGSGGNSTGQLGQLGFKTGSNFPLGHWMNPGADEDRFANVMKQFGGGGLQGIGTGGSTGSFSPIASEVAKQVVTQLPPALYATTLSQPAPAAVFAPTITVTGETLDTMEATALAAVRSAFTQARTSSIRSGSSLAQNIGPNR